MSAYSSVERNLPASAYAQTMKEAESPRELERIVFSQVTRDLEASFKSGEASHSSTRVQDALARNQKLWSTLMFDVMEEGNRLPKDLRARIISLAMFVDRHTSEILAGRKDAAPLIALNRSVISGLRGVSPAPEGA